MPDAGVEEEHGVVVPDVVALERGHIGDGDVDALGSCILSRTGVPPSVPPGSGEAGADAEAMSWKEERSEVEPRAIIRTGAAPVAGDAPRAACLDWLDRQPPKSVIFVSFGSGGSLPTEQMQELALGLELSGQRFLWVVRSPRDEGAVNTNYYDAESKKDPMAQRGHGCSNEN
ncbi:hypothetical protein ZWY2020_016182 [Hordeum vulgare]|nr:hypothetical protein ZWY2020_016182 [Hordeum vulgare]